jgi:hypothetical protein
MIAGPLTRAKNPGPLIRIITDFEAAVRFWNVNGRRACRLFAAGLLAASAAAMVHEGQNRYFQIASIRAMARVI